MARIKKRGTSGAAKNYITRNQALKRLQVSLADFRRLCILKGIFPRQPRHSKRANKGSSAPATFYYAKDIAYLQHEPVLRALREHKAFAKKLTRAIGRREWAMAKGLDESRPTYRLDHIIKERYPTFDDSLRDVDDALSLLTLFANLPASDSVPAELVASCAQLCAQWQLYVMRTRTLTKVFLSIKGIYFQAQLRGQTITWLVPYMFTQQVPHDVDFRIMSTFLELYRTLMGFVLFKLYTDANLVYPPAFDADSDEKGAGVGALRLTEANKASLEGGNSAGRLTEAGPSAATTATAGPGGKKLSARDVKRQIKAIARDASAGGADADADTAGAEIDGAGALPAEREERLEAGDEFVEAPSKSGATASAGLVSLAQLGGGASSSSSSELFSPYYFYLSREVPRTVLEFVLRSFGASSDRIGWDAVAGAGSALDEADARITHHIVDRPLPTSSPPEAAPAGPRRRVYVQPQWVVDCANAGKLLPTAPYAPGEVLPPHLSPFVDHDELRRQGGYVPREAVGVGGGEADAVGDEDEASDDAAEEDDDDEAGDEEMAGEGADDAAPRPALAALLADPTSVDKEAAAELEAEAAGGEEALLDLRARQAAAKKKASRAAAGAESKRGQPASAGAKRGEGEDEEAEARSMAKMLMSNKQRKLYTKLSYSEGKRAEEKARLEKKRRALDKKASSAAPTSAATAREGKTGRKR